MPCQPTRCLIKAVVCMVLLGSLAGCGQPADSREPAATTAEEDADFVRMATAGRMLSDLQDFLKSEETAPRTFTFDRLDFRPGSASVRPVDEKTVYAIANALQEHPAARIRIVGYDDGSGTGDANAILARRRAAAVVTALRQAGVSSSRLEASIGREGNGARSTELVVLQK
jgi:outer membrane protein OmpA-like peptidoglycan-associated protein